MRPSTLQRGSVAVELALVLPLLMMILAGIAGVGTAFYDQMALVNATRAGLQYALVEQSQNTASISSAASSDASHDLPGIVVSTPAVYQMCSDGSAYSGSGSCGGFDATPWTYVQVSASYSFPVFLASFIPGLPSTLSLSQTSIMRIN